MTNRLVIFDVDGTLVDSQAHILASMEGAFAALDLSAPTREETLGIVGLSLPVAVLKLAPDLNLEERDLLVQAYKDTFQKIRLSGTGASPLYPGTQEMLAKLVAQDGLLLGIATGKSRRGLDHLIETHNLGQYFATKQVADDHPSKPHPSMIEAALNETGVSPADAVMVGDTSFDMDMGRAAGVRTVGVSWGYHNKDQLSQADRVINSWRELDAVLQGYWSAS